MRSKVGSRQRWAAADAVIWFVAVYLAVFLRYDFSLASLQKGPTVVAASISALSQILVGVTWGPYSVRHSLASFEEVVDLARAVVISALPLLAWTLLVYPPPLARSTAIIAAMLALLAMCTLRFVRRAYWIRRSRRRSGTRRALVFGAGAAGHRIVRALLAEKSSRIVPVGLLDDDPAKRRLRIQGVPVLGSRHRLAEVVDSTDAQLLIVATTRATPQALRELSGAAAEAGVSVKVLPSLREIMTEQPSINDLRDLDLADLLGRRPVNLDLDVLAAQIRGKRILVTGAGGSIGSELCRQVSRFQPARLFMLDRDESGLHATQVSLAGHGLLDTDDTVLADIRDAAALHEVMQRCRPDMVLHAAALKHLPLLERYPLEAWKTNVLGTLNALRAAAAAGVSTFVTISTDKAANPQSILGYSKRLTEMLTAHFGRVERGRYVSVRFGNVLGSRGSVIPTFASQIESGGPVTVTDPQVERYFMLIPEACQVVLQAAALGDDGEVMVLDMGEPVRIVDVARTLIGMSGRRDIDIVFTGLRPGEKPQEELFSPTEDRRKTVHELVEAVDVPALDPARLPTGQLTHEQAAEWMRTAATSLTGSTDPAVPPGAPPAVALPPVL